MGPTVPKLEVECVHCGGAVTLTESIWSRQVIRDGTQVPPCDPEVQRATWTCPYCARENEGGFAGKIALATKAGGSQDYESVVADDLPPDRE